MPDEWNTARKLKALQKAFAEFLYAHARQPLMENKALGLLSDPGEDEAQADERPDEPGSGHVHLARVYVLLPSMPP